MLTSASCVPVGPRLMQKVHISCPKATVSQAHNWTRSGPCSRCFSNAHSCLACQGRICCSSCFRLGHIEDLCRFLPCFLGLSESSSFSNQVNSNLWDQSEVALWFRNSVPLAGTPTTLVFHSFVDLGIFGNFQWTTPAGASSSSPWKALGQPQSRATPSQVPLVSSSPPDSWPLIVYTRITSFHPSRDLPFFSSIGLSSYLIKNPNCYNAATTDTVQILHPLSKAAAIH